MTKTSALSENPEQNREQRLLAKAKEGNLDSIVKLGVAYYHGEGVPQDYDKAFLWMYGAAVNGHVQAMFNVAMMLYTQTFRGVTGTETLRWFRRAAREGHADAQAMMGLFYSEGFLGLNANDRLAVKWYKKAVEKGHDWAAYSLYERYSKGRGVRLSVKKALA